MDIGTHLLSKSKEESESSMLIRILYVFWSRIIEFHAEVGAFGELLGFSGSLRKTLMSSGGSSGDRVPIFSVTSLRLDYINPQKR
jgi:hypothetical protein